MPPLTAVLALVFDYIGIIFGVFWIIQISRHFDIFLILFPLNFIILSIHAIKQSYMFNTAESVNYKNRFLLFLNKIALIFARSPFLAVLLILPVWVIITCILMLFGQTPDSTVKAFTETSQWVFSQRISPPDIERVGEHYLCTVAAFGHKKLVKPLRFGKRHGHVIIVNRQLMIANAFEELIKERTPRFHRFLRGTYDKIGLPISKYIKNKAASDITYCVMKPLEWLFLAVLYMFDLNPETRILRQYSE
jgi:hypothetical protein